MKNARQKIKANRDEGIYLTFKIGPGVGPPESKAFGVTIADRKGMPVEELIRFEEILNIIINKGDPNELRRLLREHAQKDKLMAQRNIASYLNVAVLSRSKDEIIDLLIKLGGNINKHLAPFNLGNLLTIGSEGLKRLIRLGLKKETIASPGSVDKNDAPVLKMPLIAYLSYYLMKGTEAETHASLKDPDLFIMYLELIKEKFFQIRVPFSCEGVKDIWINHDYSFYFCTSILNLPLTIDVDKQGKPFLVFYEFNHFTSETTDYLGNTLLHIYALDSRGQELEELIKARKINPFVQNCLKQTAADLARYLGNENHYQALKAYELSFEQELKQNEAMPTPTPISKEQETLMRLVREQCESPIYPLFASQEIKTSPRFIRAPAYFS